MQKFTLGTAVLAGGKSSRMGQNKVLMEYQNRRFLDRICEELRGFDEKPCISAAIPGEYEDLGLPVVCDEHREIGPMEGIRQVLIHTSCDYVFVCAGDMPFITGNLVRYMAEFISSDYDCYCMVDEDHIHPLCAIYSKKNTAGDRGTDRTGAVSPDADPAQGADQIHPSGEQLF